MAVHRCESAQFQSHSPCMKASSPAAISAFHPGSCELNLWRRQNRGGRAVGRVYCGSGRLKGRWKWAVEGAVDGRLKDSGTTVKGQGHCPSTTKTSRLHFPLAVVVVEG